jgi:hypothetical protein
LKELSIALLVIGGIRTAIAADWYQIEVIGFRYPAAAETSATSSTVPDFSAAVHLVFEDTVASTTTITAYSILPASSQTLGDAYQRLNRSNAQQVLFHTGWRQNGIDSRPVYLSDQQTTAIPSATQETTPIPATTEGTLRFQTDGKQYRITTQFVAHQNDQPVVLGETRNITLNELNYFDNVLIGLLVEVTKIGEDGLPLSLTSEQGARPSDIKDEALPITPATPTTSPARDMH